MFERVRGKKKNYRLVLWASSFYGRQVHGERVFILRAFALNLCNVLLCPVPGHKHFTAERWMCPWPLRSSVWIIISQSLKWENRRGPGVKFPVQGLRIWSFIGKLGSHIPWAVTKKQTNREIERQGEGKIVYFITVGRFKESSADHHSRTGSRFHLNRKHF